jgi:putative transposase
MTTLRDPLYAGYRYPAELISYAIWLYFRFLERAHGRGDAGRSRHLGHIRLSCESDQQPARGSKSAVNSPTAPRRGDKWHLDEVVHLAGKRHPVYALPSASRGDRLEPGGSCRAPEGTAGPPLGDGVIRLKGAVHRRASNLEHQVRTARRPTHLLLGIHPAM